MHAELAVWLLLWGAVAFNVAAGAASLYARWMMHRITMLLTNMAVESLLNHNLPLWQAYANRLGRFQISIEVVPPIVGDQLTARDRKSS